MDVFGLLCEYCECSCVVWIFILVMLIVGNGFDYIVMCLGLDDLYILV